MQIAMDKMKTNITQKRVHWTEPAGGYLIWIQMDGLQKNEDDLNNIFLKNGVRLMPGQVSFPEKTSQKYFRLSISTLNEDEIIEGVSRIGKALTQIYQG